MTGGGGAADEGGGGYSVQRGVPRPVAERRGAGVPQRKYVPFWKQLTQFSSCIPLIMGLVSTQQ